jgi:hypothetical protein
MGDETGANFQTSKSTHFQNLLYYSYRQVNCNSQRFIFCNIPHSKLNSRFKAQRFLCTAECSTKHCVLYLCVPCDFSNTRTVIISVHGIQRLVVLTETQCSLWGMNLSSYAVYIIFKRHSVYVCYVQTP